MTRKLFTHQVCLVSTVVLLTAVVARWSTCSAKTAADSLPPQQTAADARYYVTLFSYQDAENHAMMSHTFAVFTKLSGAATNAAIGDVAPAAIESRTISWLPARFAETLRLSVVTVPGKNFTLPETLELARRVGSEVRHWGPFEIDALLYQNALAQYDRLNSGAVKYKMYNSASLAPLARQNANCSHCIDAVADIGGRIRTGTARGFEAGEQILRHFTPHFRSPQAVEGLYDLVLNTPEVQPTAPTLVAFNGSRK